MSPEPAALAGTQPSARRMVWVVAVLGACFVAIRAGLPDAPALWFAALRALLAGVVLLTLGFLRRARLPRGAREWAVVAGLGLTNATLGLSAMFVGAEHLSTGVASVLANAQPLLIVLPAWALYGERPTRRTVAGLVVGFAGLLVVAVPGGAGPGALFSLGSAAAATAGTLLARRLGTVDNMVAGGWSFTLGGATLALWAGLAEGPPEVHWGLRFVAILAFLGVIGTAAAYVAWFKEARRCPLYRLTAWTFAVPVVGLVLAMTLEGEHPSAWTAAGLSVVLGSLWLVLRGAKTHGERHPAPASGSAVQASWEEATAHGLDPSHGHGPHLLADQPGAGRNEKVACRAKTP